MWRADHQEYAELIRIKALWYNWEAGEPGSGFLSSVAALTSTVGSGIHFVLLKDISMCMVLKNII